MAMKASCGSNPVRKLATACSPLKAAARAGAKRAGGAGGSQSKVSGENSGFSPKIQWQQSKFAQELMKREGLKDEEGLQSWFVKRIGKFLESKNRRLTRHGRSAGLPRRLVVVNPAVVVRPLQLAGGQFIEAHLDHRMHLQDGGRVDRCDWALDGFRDGAGFVFAKG